jgi:hypothetical protein
MTDPKISQFLKPLYDPYRSKVVNDDTVHQPSTPNVEFVRHSGCSSD